MKSILFWLWKQFSKPLTKKGWVPKYSEHAQIVRRYLNSLKAFSIFYENFSICFEAFLVCSEYHPEMAILHLQLRNYTFDTILIQAKSLFSGDVLFWELN